MLYTVQQAAELLGISENTLRGRIRRKTVSTVRKEGRVYVQLDRTTPVQPAYNSRTTDRTTPVQSDTGPEASANAPETPKSKPDGYPVGINPEAFQAVLEAHRREAATLREMIEAQNRQIERMEQKNRQDRDELMQLHADQVARLHRVVLQLHEEQNRLLHLADRLGDRVRPLSPHYTVREHYREGLA